jgi:LacI family transcriptional regulator
LDRRPEGLDSGAILVDDHGWAKRATEHLCRHGHQRIAIVADDMRIKTSAHRLEGYRSALREWSLDVDSRLEALDCEQADDAYRATLGLLDLAQPPTAIFSARSETTVGVINALHHQDRTDTALVSFGDVELADLLSPPVTVVDHSARTLARRALERLRGRMRGGAETPDDEIIDMRLIERGSGEIRPRVASAATGGGVR